MLQKASLSGITNLKSQQYRNDSPISDVKKRFPDKFVGKRQERDEKGHSKDVLEKSKVIATAIENVLPSDNVLEGIFRSTETEEKIKERMLFMEKTMAENQFILEASFCAVSDLLMEGFDNDFDQWLGLSLVDKVLQFTSLLQHMRKDIRLGGLVGVY
jgi:hypothetical protein